ncbi:hypothetical protein D3C75_528890 [compost metagenome]
MTNAASQGIFNRVRLFVDLFLHVVAINTFVARVILQTGFDIRAFNLLTFGIKHGNGTTSHFRNITFFKEDETTGDWQQSQLIGGDKVFTHTEADNHRATRTCGQQNIRITGVHDYGAIRAT